MITSHTATTMLLSTLWVLSLLAGCSTPTQNLKPIAEQNQQNINALTSNVDTLIALYEPLLQASTRALVYQHIAKTEQEIISVVGAAMLPPPPTGDSWEKLLERAANYPIPRREKYLPRFRWVKSALERGVEQAELDKLKQDEGWIYTAAADPDFTPQAAHELIKRLSTLAKNNRDNIATFYAEAELQLAPYDPKLVHYRQASQAAQDLLMGLKQEISFELATASLHGQAITGFVASSPTTAQTLKAAAGGMNAQELTAVLNKLSEKYLQNASYKEGAIDLLTQGLKQFLIQSL